MADIANCNVYTNGVVSNGSSDLLHQAFQGVVDDEDRDNEFVAYFHGEGIERQPIQLSHAQPYRLTFEVDSVDGQTNNITYDPQQNVMLNEIQNNGGLGTSEHAPQQNGLMETMTFQTTSTSPINNESAMESSLQEWMTEPQDSNQDGVLENGPTQIEGLETAESYYQNNDQFSEHQNVQKIYVQNSVSNNVVNVNNSKIQFAVHASQPQNYQQNNVIPRTSQAQILQRIPVLLPSSQFIIKPSQTVMKSTKNIRILPSTNKMGNVGMVNGNGTQNSLLLPKGVLSTVSPQILKLPMPLTTHFINTSTVPSQMLHSSQIMTSNCNSQNQNGNINRSRTAKNVTNTPVRFSNATKTSTGMIQRGNGQQLFIQTPKTAQDGTIVKSVQVSNGNVGKNGMTGQFFKSVQIPAHMLRSANTTFIRTSAPSSTPGKSTTTTSAPIVFRTASLLKSQDLKTVTTNASSVLRTSSQGVPNPISILKPQTKGIPGTQNQQSFIINGQNLVVNPQNNRFVQKPINSQINDVNERIKTAQNNAKRRASENAAAAAKLVKRAKAGGVTNPNSGVKMPQNVVFSAEEPDFTKPLGSSDNPIQIVQPGPAFHSGQELSQSQLRQITQVLQQKSHETGVSTEKIIYRVVFPGDLDLQMRNPANNNVVKPRGAKRGRPKKTAVKPIAPAVKTPAAPEEEPEDTKDDRKRVVARTRSGRLSRPPPHMMRDYKHLHYTDAAQPDHDESDGGYSDYNTNAEKIDTDGSPKELLSGLEVPKRKISDHFRCPTCNKIYLGRSRMAKHFELFPDHGSSEQLPPPTPEPEPKPAAAPQDPLKRKGKKRGPWAYVTPEAKSERRQLKLKEAITVCDNREIINIAAKPVVNAQSLFELLVLKSDNNVRTFISELTGLMNKVREQVGAMLTVAVDGDSATGDVVDLQENSLCNALGLNPGVYKINNEALRKPEETFSSEVDTSISEATPQKIQQTHDAEDGKEIMEERMSSGFSESSDMSASDFLNESKSDLANSNCPEVLSALTLMPRNMSNINAPEVTKSNNMSKLLISNPEIQDQISENPGFQKIDINSSNSFRKIESLKDGYAKLTESLELENCSSVFTKLDEEYEQKMQQSLQQSFIKLEPMKQGFKLENSTVSAYVKEDSQCFDKMQNGYETLETGSSSFAKGFNKLISKIVPMESDEQHCNQNQVSTMDENAEKISTIFQDTEPIPMSVTCDPTSIFGSTENLDIVKMTGYENMPHLDMLSTNDVDELVSEGLKSHIMPEHSLENNLIPNNSIPDNSISNDSNINKVMLTFEDMAEEFNRNTQS